MSKRSGGKSILATFGAFSETKGSADSPIAGSENRDVVAPIKPQAARVGAGVIGATQRSLSELIEQRDRLQAIVDGGGGVELSPDVIEPSPFPDRLADDSEDEFAAFKQSFSENGQKVPIEVRRHPEKDGFYQVVYGHRRWRAAKELGLSLKAVVVDLDDAELVVAQGIENGQRQDLSWVERALFAATMDDAGIRTKDIRSALSIDDAELAKMRSVCRAVPRDIIRSIGRAPTVGRPRWLEFASALTDQPDGESTVRKTLSSDKVLHAPSDSRFRTALAALKHGVESKLEPVKLTRPDGRAFGSATFGKGVMKISLPKDRGEEFAGFLERELPALVDRFFAEDRDN